MNNFEINRIIQIKDAELRGEWLVIVYEEDLGIVGFKSYDKMPPIFLLDIGYLIDKSDRMMI